MQNTFRSLVHQAPSRASRGARLSLRTCESPLQPPTGALLPAILVSMAGGPDDPVGGGGTDGAACVGGGHMTTSSRGGFECLTRDWKSAPPKDDACCRATLEHEDQVHGAPDIETPTDADDIAETSGQRAKEIRTVEERPTMATHQAAEEIEGIPRARERQRVMRAITLLVSRELRVSILQGTLLWPGGQVCSNQPARAVGTSSRNPLKHAWSRLDPWEYGFQKFGTLWKYLVDEYLVNATPSLGSWGIRRCGQSIFVKLTLGALQACPLR